MFPFASPDGSALRHCWTITAIGYRDHLAVRPLSALAAPQYRRNRRDCSRRRPYQPPRAHRPLQWPNSSTWTWRVCRTTFAKSSPNWNSSCLKVSCNYGTTLPPPPRLLVVTFHSGVVHPRRTTKPTTLSPSNGPSHSTTLSLSCYSPARRRGLKLLLVFWGYTALYQQWTTLTNSPECYFLFWISFNFSVYVEFVFFTKW